MPVLLDAMLRIRISCASSSLIIHLTQVQHLEGLVDRNVDLPKDIHQKEATKVCAMEPAVRLVTHRCSCTYLVHRDELSCAS